MMAALATVSRYRIAEIVLIAFYPVSGFKNGSFLEMKELQFR
jgi:hypothetical protein